MLLNLNSQGTKEMSISKEDCLRARLRSSKISFSPHSIEQSKSQGKHNFKDEYIDYTSWWEELKVILQKALLGRVVGNWDHFCNQSRGCLSFSKECDGNISFSHFWQIWVMKSINTSTEIHFLSWIVVICGAKALDILPQHHFLDRENISCGWMYFHIIYK